ncbi:MAG: RecX family transcriptional regulator [Chloroflexi bacterium]|nr:RecX family transcriptional regulator [Chloroflexota bacterium]
MKKVTALRLGRGRGKRVNIYLDDRFAFSLEAEVAVREGLKVGQELATDQIEALARLDSVQRCLNVATRYLSYRPRSESELRERLCQRGFDSDSVEVVLGRLREQGLVNDVDFAQFWQDNRQSFSPRSRWLTRLELRRKGVAEEIIDQVVSAASDDDSAYRAALGRARRLPVSDYQGFRRRLGGYLKRRGFSYGVINNTVEQLWQQMRD